MIWAATIDKAAKQIFKLIKQKKGYGYVTRRWWIISIVIKILPNWIRIRI